MNIRTIFTFLVGLAIIVAAATWCYCAHSAATSPTIRMKVTAYCPCKKCCGKWADGITASGAKAQGKLIAAPKEIPFGTWINVPGYGWAEVKDRGGSIKRNRLDVFFESHQEALEWGVKYLEIEQ